MSLEVVFSVAGDPATKGSWRPVRSKGGRIRMLPQISREKPWAEAVAWAARAAMQGRPPSIGPVQVAAIFAVAPPKRTKLVAPRGDVDKFARSVLDALTGICYLDDSQVVELFAKKIWGAPGVMLSVVEMADLLLAPAATPGGIVSAALRREPGWARRVSSALQPADVGDAEPGSVGAELAGRGRAARAHRCAEAQGDAGLAQVGVGAGARIGDRSQILRAGQQEEEDGQDANAAHDRQRGANLHARQGRAARRKKNI